MKFAVIGSGTIVEKFISAGRLVKDFELVAVYSRTEAREGIRRRAGRKYAFSSLDELAACPEVEAVYIASPNYAHCEQSIRMLSAGKHVFVRKAHGEQRA